MSSAADADWGGSRSVIRVGVRGSSPSFLTRDSGLGWGRPAALGFACTFTGDARFMSAVSASGGLYIVLGRLWRFPGPVSCSFSFASDVGADSAATAGETALVTSGR